VAEVSIASGGSRRKHWGRVLGAQSGSPSTLRINKTAALQNDAGRMIEQFGPFVASNHLVATRPSKQVRARGTSFAWLSPLDSA
jgi:hypothetical protein